MNKPSRRLLFESWALWILFIAAFSLQLGYDALTPTLREDRYEAQFNRTEPLLPSLTALRLVSLGQPEVTADLLWLNAIQYFGTGNRAGNHPSLGPILDRITDLDPTHIGAYELGLITLPFQQNGPLAAQLGEKALQNLPNNGLLTYYTASVYHLNLRNYERASALYLRAAELPGAPTAAKTLGGITLTSASQTKQDRAAAIGFWQTVLEDASTDQEREYAQDWLTTNIVLEQVESAAAQYKYETGQDTTDLEVLSSRYALDFTIPITRTIVLDTDGTASVSFNARRL